MLSNECLMGAKYFFWGGGVSRVDHSGSDNEIRRRLTHHEVDAFGKPIEYRERDSKGTAGRETREGGVTHGGEAFKKRRY
jgi:hypothetical protein